MATPLSAWQHPTPWDADTDLKQIWVFKAGNKKPAEILFFKLGSVY